MDVKIKGSIDKISKRFIIIILQAFSYLHPMKSLAYGVNTGLELNYEISTVRSWPNLPLYELELDYFLNIHSYEKRHPTLTNSALLKGHRHENNGSDSIIIGLINRKNQPNTNLLNNNNSLQNHHIIEYKKYFQTGKTISWDLNIQNTGGNQFLDSRHYTNKINFKVQSETTKIISNSFGLYLIESRQEIKSLRHGIFDSRLNLDLNHNLQVACIAHVMLIEESTTPSNTKLYFSIKSTNKKISFDLGVGSKIEGLWSYDLIDYKSEEGIYSYLSYIVNRNYSIFIDLQYLRNIYQYLDSDFIPESRYMAIGFLQESLSRRASISTRISFASEIFTDMYQYKQNNFLITISQHVYF